MNRSSLKLLNPQSQIYNVLGNVANNPGLILDNNLKLEKKDFPLPFHRTIFFAINNLVASTGKLDEIGALDVDTYLSQFEEYYKVFNDNDGINWLQDAKDTANKGTFVMNYHYVKKMSVLRMLIKKGFDISELYNLSTDDNEVLSAQQQALNDMSEEEVVNHFMQDVSEIKDVVSGWKNSSESFMAGDGIMDLIDRADDNPMYGYGFTDEYLNTFTGGMQLGKLMLRSLVTGGGKTRLGLLDMLNVSATEIRNAKTGRWMKQESPDTSLFISTELEKDEIQLILLAAVTRLSPSIIKKGGFSDEVHDILVHGAQVLHDTNIYFTTLLEFDIQDVTSTIERNVLEHGVKYVNFDYIQASSKLLRSGNELFGGRETRDDQLLLELTKALKDQAADLGIFIETATQLNGENSDDYMISRTQGALRGAKSIADKIDIGMITANLNSKDISNLQDIINDPVANPTGMTPDQGSFIYKNRLGDKGVVIWSKVDLGMLTYYPLFVTDYNYNRLDVERTSISVKDDGNYTVKDNIKF